MTKFEPCLSIDTHHYVSCSFSVAEKAPKGPAAWFWLAQSLKILHVAATSGVDLISEGPSVSGDVLHGKEHEVKHQG